MGTCSSGTDPEFRAVGNVSENSLVVGNFLSKNAKFAAAI